MSEKIDPREVLAYLNELGFMNINAQQLKDFVTDLKKLIKYEKKHRKNNVNTCKPTCTDTKCTSTEKLDQSFDDPKNQFDQSINTEDKQSERDVFRALYDQPTIASKAKEVPRRKKHISVHITKPKTKKHIEDHCTHVERHLYSPELRHGEKVQENHIQISRAVEVTCDGSKVKVDTESTIKSVSSKPTSPKLKPKSSFIRPSCSKTFNKCDPVALYHYYQEEWKKQKFPGQDHHSDLRWAVREKMLGGPKVNIPSTVSSCRRRCNSWKG